MRRAVSATRPSARASGAPARASASASPSATAPRPSRGARTPRAQSAEASSEPRRRRSSTRRWRSSSRRWTRARSAPGAAGHSGPQRRAAAQAYRLRVAERYRPRPPRPDRPRRPPGVHRRARRRAEPSTIEGAILPCGWSFAGPVPRAPPASTRPTAWSCLRSSSASACGRLLRKRSSPRGGSGGRPRDLGDSDAGRHRRGEPLGLNAHALSRYASSWPVLEFKRL